MAASGTSSGAAPSLDRVICEAFVKAASVVLESRIYTPKPFNLELDEVEGASKALERWRRETGLPLVLEVFLQPWGAALAGQHDRVETLLERWVVHYYPQLPEGASHLSRSHLSRLNPSSVYKRLVITLRSLYTYVRVLPAYRMFRACKRQRGANFTLGYRLHSTLPGSGAAAAPGARRMLAFRFGAVDTPYGQLRISVDYQPASTVTILEQTTSPPPLPQIIADYVGSPAAARRAAPPLRHAASAAWPPSPSPPTPTARRQQPGAPPSPHAAAQPGSSPQGGGARPGSLPIRRSWSTSMRGAFPQRGPYQPAGDPPHPLSAADSPYGSAPQGASLPAMLRTLSTPPARHAVGSPSSLGRPPLAKPPRSSTAPLAAAPAVPHAAAGRPAPLRGSPRSGGGLADEAGSECGSPCGSASSSARQSSAPVSIPGRGGAGLCGRGGAGAAARRLRSSGDLWALQQAAAMHKPLSAPAVSHMQAAAAAEPAAAATPAAAAGEGSAAGSGGGSRGRAAAAGGPLQLLPPARLPLVPGLECESSGSAASSLYNTSCSPQLPFAFTPSAQSLASFGARGALQESARLERVSPRLGRTLSGASSGGAHAAAAGQLAQQRGAAAGTGSAGSAGAGSSPGSGGSGVTGRQVPASMALMRRPSWPSRSSHQLPGEASQPGVGYSVSPMQDAALETILAGSTPRQYVLGGGSGLPSPFTSAPLAGGPPPHAGGGTGRAGSGATPPLLTFPPSASGELSGALDEADVLPFALDEAAASSPLTPPSPAVAPAPGQPLTAAARQPAAPPPATADADAAVGAFVRLIHEAPPLRMHGVRLARRAASADLSLAGRGGAAPGTSSGSDSSCGTCLSDGRGLTLQAGLLQFSRIRERLQQRGVVVGAAEA